MRAKNKNTSQELSFCSYACEKHKYTKANKEKTFYHFGAIAVVVRLTPPHRLIKRSAVFPSHGYQESHCACSSCIKSSADLSSVVTGSEKNGFHTFVLSA